MLVNLVEILNLAEEKHFAVGAFNTPNLECILAVVDTAEKLNVPVILSHAQLHEDVAPLDKIGPVMLEAARRAKVPVCVHLDHCETLDYMARALELGFTGVMYDGSTLPYAENLENTKKAVAMAKGYNCGVEAELGALASREGGGASASGPVYTDPEQAVEFCEKTGIDALAPSFGTAHGIYKSKPVLDLERVKVIAQKTGLPLVMHGGSGVSPEDYRTGIANGLRKINYYSYMSKAGTQAVKELLAREDITFFHDLALAAQKAMQSDAEQAMRVFAGL
ncbi:ketose-bisphosphate aldolase [Flavonifractor sp. An92]|uniref:class II fructose-bisphosphate aldolase n=1 Tax=Flavonifractor sp. An92 TaxID=1965666 RepID=UPI000B368C4E|nr:MULTISPECIES: class II fructose-bisphosphate aldolase [unclassified Flavonifractor]OUN06344.1 ketose-bisphosphate aldolase [Flavonifractor sp. An92]OUQ23665.1 ketose-bisphosphate aldolase [Flavonifractor sp. An135]